MFKDSVKPQEFLHATVNLVGALHSHIRASLKVEKWTNENMWDFLSFPTGIDCDTCFIFLHHPVNAALDHVEIRLNIFPL